MKKIYLNPDYPPEAVSELPEMKKEMAAHGYDVYFDNRGRALEAEELYESLRGSYAYCNGTSLVTGELLDRFPEIRIISRIGIGYENVDVAAATARGVAVCVCPGAGAESVAEHCLGLMLGASRRIVEMDREMRKGEWKRYIGPSLYRKTLGLIGTGNIGKQLAKIVSGFDMRIMAYDIEVDAKFAAQKNVTYSKSLEDVLRAADYVSLHIPKTPETENMIGMQQFKLMKSSAIIINASRGGIIKEDDLYTALKDKVITAAGLDVFSVEPPGLENPLFTLPNVVVTAHNAGSSAEGKNTVIRHALEKILTIDQGQIPLGMLNPEIFNKNTGD